MTAMDRADRLPKFEDALREALREDAGTPQTDYLTDILVQTVASRQRPAWTYPSRWLPMSVITSRAAAPPRVPWRILVAVGLIVLVVASALAVAGSRSKVPPPFGRAADGLLAYSQLGDIFTVDPVTGQSTKVVGTADNDHDPIWSRDGTHMAFVRDVASTAQRLYVGAPDGTELKLITPTALPGIRDQAFSPDGREVLFTAGPDDDRELWIATTDGSGARRIADVHPAQPTWLPPTGAEIVYADRVPDGQPNGIYAVDPRTGTVRAILDPTPGFGRDALTVSPDGKRVTFSESLIPDPGIGNTYQVHIVGTDGTDHGTLPAAPGTTFQDAAVWSNDGTRLAIVRGYAAHNEDMAIAIVPADGSGFGVETARGLTGCCDNGLAWSPADDAVYLLGEDVNGNVKPQQLIDPVTGQTRPAPGGATTWPAQQRRAP